MTWKRCPSCNMLTPPEERDKDDVCNLCRPGDPPWWRVQQSRTEPCATADDAQPQHSGEMGGA